MNTRREFMQWAGAALGSPWVAEMTAWAGSEGPLSGSAKRLPDRSHSDSDVGSLFPFIQRQAVQSDFPLSFLREEFTDLPAWQRRARARLLELLHYAPAKCEPRPEVVEREDRGDYVREKVYFNTTPDLRVPAYVLLPKKPQGPRPAVIALHDHGAFYFWGKEKLTEMDDEHPALTAFKKQSYSGRSIASDLARQGYVVIVIDMFYWGERRLLFENDPPDWRERPRSMPVERVTAFNRRAQEAGELVGRTILAAGFTWSGVMFWDDLRTVDYLLTRPEVDPQRIACVGLSVGGLRSCHLAALDPRIKAAVVVGWMASFPAQLRNYMRHSIGHVMLVPGLYREMDYPDVATQAMPAALLVINGSKDTLFEPHGVQVCFDKLHACYKKAGIPERVRTRLYDTPHEFNAAMQAEAWEWLKRWL
jgi:dienelactone hydrolase